MKAIYIMSKAEVKEYLGPHFKHRESDYPKLIQGDMQITLENEGFQTITMDDITVVVHD
ncbi:hypothetical protein [Xenorhabdus santafensis]|uniref:hypothetical protein n=1 Tax=Xenorhabdus santafensis TaxID=2582833 RepID=UPI0029E7D7B1|nr:hypothetical protein [Xenorhabdus sp. 12]